MVTTRATGSNSSIFRLNFQIYLEDFGTKVTRSRTTVVKDSMKRVTSSSTVTASYDADIQWVNKKNLLHLNVGDVKVGDGMLFVKHTADILLEDEITYNSKQWRVVSQMEGEQVAGDVIYLGFIIRKNAQ